MTPDVDPRFDPRFQRGFDAAIHRVPKSERPTPVVAQVIPAPAPEEPAETPAGRDAEHATVGRNPFHLALLLASLASIVGSAVVYWFWYDAARNGFSYNSFTPSWEFFWAQFGGSIPGPLLSAGFIGLVGWVALGAFVVRSRDRA
jgi:hypothetical protein